MAREKYYYTDYHLPSKKTKGNGVVASTYNGMFQKARSSI